MEEATGEMMNKHILAFDPGTTNFAWANYKHEALLDYDCIKIANNYDSYDETTRKLVPLIDDQIRKCDLVVVENQFKQKMNCVATIVRTVACLRKKPFKTIHPTKVKCHFKLPKAPSSLSTKGKHNFNKTVAVKHVNDILAKDGFKPIVDHNCADAILLALYAHENKI